MICFYTKEGLIMFRLRITSILCLAALLLFSQTAWADSKGDKSKVRINGTKVSVEVMEKCSIKVSQSAYLKDSDNKVLLRWKRRDPKKVLRSKNDSDVFSCHYYDIDMLRYEPGRYTLVTESFQKKISVPFDYLGRSEINFQSSKAVRNNNGDMVQRFYFQRNNTAGKVFHAQFFDEDDQRVYSFSQKLNNSNDVYSFSWDGWPEGDTANRCLKGVYSLKYWVDGTPPKVKKIKLVI